MRLMPYSLQGRFLAGLVFIMLIMGTFFAFALRVYMKDLLLSEARAKANLMVAQVAAIQTYVRDVLRPAVAQTVAPDGFIIEAMSTSFVTRHILSDLSVDEEDFTYRRVARNARNPISEMTPEESAILDKFLQRPELRRIESAVRTNTGDRLLMARPVYFTPDCMRCHGEPRHAPAVLLSMYGEDRGFYRKAGELAGLDIISVPQESITGAVAQSTTMFVVWFFGGMAVLLLAVQGFFNRLVVHNLRRVGDILHRNFFKEAGGELLAPLHKEEEIEGVVRSIETVAEHLSGARRQLAAYAENLEGMVKERTAELEEAASERSADLQLFMRLLSDLSRSRGKRDLLNASMRMIGRRLNIFRAVYVCGISGSDYLVFPENEQAAVKGDAALQAEFVRRLREGDPARLPDVWYIPVQSAGYTRGLLALYLQPEAEEAEEAEGNRPRPDQFALALAFGRQLGIALDNLESLDALLRQNTLLDSIVEGIADPLILLEQGCTPVLANSAVRALLRRLSPENTEKEETGTEYQGPGGAYAAREAGRLLALMGLPPGLPLPEHAVQREIMLADGSSFVLGIHPLHTETGRPRAVVHLRETTEEKLMLQNLCRSEKLAAVGQLSAGLAHEINNPLGVIRCYAELLHAACDAEKKADLDIILRHVDSAQSVLRDLLDFARPHGAGPTRCSPGSLLSALVEVFRPKARQARAEMLLEADPKLPELYCDVSMLEQALVNLLLNALDAVNGKHGDNSGRQGLICIRAYKNTESDTLCIDVSDNGHGIRETDMPKVFDPFFTTKEPGAGTGLGLTVSYSLVRELGGSLEVHCGEDGVGTLFRVTLPVADSVKDEAP